MKKPLTAKALHSYLSELENEGHDLSKITINYRFDPDSEVENITYVGEDLFDAETNNLLESIIFITDASEYED